MNILKISTVILGTIIPLISAIFAIPIKEVPYSATEKYYETEIKKIPHIKEEPFS